MELMNLENGVKITSNVIARLTDKRHDHVIRDIENIIQEIDTPTLGSDILESTYLSRGKNYKNYMLTKDGMMLLITGYSVSHRMKLIKYCRGLEEELNNRFKVPTNFKEALQLALDQQEEIEKKDNLLLEQKPKVEFFDTVTGSNDTLDLGSVAKVINKKGYGRNKLFEFLRNKKILMQNNQPYQTYIDREYFRTIETKFTKPNGDISISIKTVVYQKGVDYINKLLNENV